MAEHPAAEKATFESLLSPVLSQAYGYARALAGHRTDAEDLLQESVVLALRAFGRFQPGTSFKAWLFKIVLNRHFERFRTARRRPETIDLEDLAHDLHELGEDPARRLMSKLGAEQVLGAIEALPAEFREVARLHLVGELEYPEIAGVLGCPVGTVRSRLHRGRKLLRKTLWQVAEDAGFLHPVPMWTAPSVPRGGGCAAPPASVRRAARSAARRSSTGSGRMPSGHCS